MCVYTGVVPELYRVKSVQKPQASSIQKEGCAGMLLHLVPDLWLIRCTSMLAVENGTPGKNNTLSVRGLLTSLCEVILCDSFIAILPDK